MDIFLKAAVGVLITSMLCLFLAKQGKDISLILSIAVCCMVITGAIEFLEPVMDFFQKLRSLGKLDSEFLNVLLKAVGIGLLAEISGLICTDSGNAALGKSLQLMASAVILWISIPLLNDLIEIVEEILGAV